MLSDRLDESPSVAAENITALTSQRQACKVQFICEELIVIYDKHDYFKFCIIHSRLQGTNERDM